MGCKKICAPSVALTTVSAPTTANVQAGATPFLRFPFFDVGYCPGREEKFVDLYECGGLNKPHAIYDYAKSNAVFASFNKGTGLYMKPGDAEFWKHVMQAQEERMVVLDVNFDAYNLERLLDVLGWRQFSTGLAVTVLTAAGDSVTTIEQNKKELMEMIRSLDNTDVEVLKLSDKNANDVHDRFALVDNCIWHFGAAVGGMHDKLHAYSGPWDDVDSAFKALTDDLRKGATQVL